MTGLGDSDKKIMPPLKKGQRRGIYLLPNLLTTGAMFSGFYAILACMDGRLEAAAIAMFVAMVFDGLDGRVARMTNTSTDFGVEYDSLSDMVSFGIAPAVVAYSWILHEAGSIGWATAFIYASCAALRLARFNTQVASVSKKYFVGLPSPAAAGVVASMVWTNYDIAQTQAAALLAAFITAGVGLLMVSNFRYNSFKETDSKGRVSFVVVLGVTVTLAIITTNPPILLAIGIVYALSAPATYLWQRFRRK